MRPAQSVGGVSGPDRGAGWRARQRRAADALLQAYTRTLSEQARGRVSRSSDAAPPAGARLGVADLATRKPAARTRRPFPAGAPAFACRTV
jgi:hypothetical protein